MKDRLRSLIYISLFAVITAVCSWISVPFTVPFTMQTFAVFLSLLLLGGKRAALSALVYIITGIIGVPVFANFGSGLGVIMGASGGYIIGFFLMALVYWLITALWGDKNAIKLVACAVGLIVCYVFGSLWYSVVYLGESNVGFAAAFATCVLPYILPDAAKLILAFLLSKRLSKVV